MGLGKGWRITSPFPLANSWSSKSAFSSWGRAMPASPRTFSRSRSRRANICNGCSSFWRSRSSSCSYAMGCSRVSTGTASTRWTKSICRPIGLLHEVDGLEHLGRGLGTRTECWKHLQARQGAHLPQALHCEYVTPFPQNENLKTCQIFIYSVLMFINT